ncbi:MAG: di-heme oxidoredictase family protein [Saprospiraceae bacterium]
MHKYLILIIFVLSLASCTNEDVYIDPLDEDVYLGGETSIEGFFINIFQQPASNLSQEELTLHLKSDQAFADIFVSAPSTHNSGLGPVFNQVSCEHCHVANGRSPFPSNTDNLRGLLFRISKPGEDEMGGPLAVDNFGTQLQTKANFGIEAEGKVDWSYSYIVGNYPDGNEFMLKNRIFRIYDTYMPWEFTNLISPRIAPPVFGLGLLEAIPEEQILLYADPEDIDNDGISGKANMVWSVTDHTFKLGRFGWKAGQPSLIQQTAGAYHQDMGLTSPLFPKESCENQTQADDYSDDPEIDLELMKITTFYAQSLGVPIRRNFEDDQVKEGKKLFRKLNCNACHREAFVTGDQSDKPFLNNQKIFPYTDLLLHDMGDGLADFRPEFVANGYEWRTPPLWGIGFTKIVGGENANYLHDGRATTLEEAILWHGGEAEESKQSFKNLTKSERNAMIKFLENL